MSIWRVEVVLWAQGDMSGLLWEVGVSKVGSRILTFAFSEALEHPEHHHMYFQ